MRLERAVPALVLCLERLTEYDPVAHAALRALQRLREHATDPLLAAFARCSSREARSRRAHRCEEVVAVAQAILALGGNLLPEQRARFERAYRRGDELWASGGPEIDEVVGR